MERRYEGIFIIDPDLTQDETEALLAQITENITKNECTVEDTQRWGKRKLAYLINKKSEGFYYLVNFTGTPTAIKSLKRLFKLTEGLMRDAIFACTKDVLAVLDTSKDE